MPPISFGSLKAGESVDVQTAPPRLTQHKVSISRFISRFSNGNPAKIGGKFALNLGLPAHFRKLRVVVDTDFDGVGFVGEAHRLRASRGELHGARCAT